MAVVKRNKRGIWEMQLSDSEMDVVYRLLKSTKQNEENTRLSIVRRILVAVGDSYGVSLDYDTDENNSKDHFGTICFTGEKHG